MLWTSLALAMLAVFFGQLVKGVAGFGSALVTMPVLAVLFGPAEGIVLMVGTDLIASAWLLKDVWSRVRWSLVAVVLLGAVPGQWVGTELLTTLDPRRTANVLGIVVLVMGAMFAWRPVTPGRGELEDLPADSAGLMALAAVAGAGMGAMAGLVGAGGPPIVAFFRRYFEPGFFRAQLITIFLFNGLMVGALVLAKGAAEPGVLTALPWLLPPMLVGSRLGARIAGIVRPVLFGRLVGLILMVAGAGLLLR